MALDVSEDSQRTAGGLIKYCSTKLKRSTTYLLKISILYGIKKNFSIHAGENRLSVLTKNSGSLTEKVINYQDRKSVVKYCKQNNIPIATSNNKDGTYKMTHRSEDTDRIEKMFQKIIKGKIKSNEIKDNNKDNKDKNKEVNKEKNKTNEPHEQKTIKKSNDVKEKGNIEKNIEAAKEKVRMAKELNANPKINNKVKFKGAR